MPISAVRLISLLFLFAFTQSAKAADSEFIENMPPLAPDGDRAGAMIWTKPGVDRASYQKIMVEPITIFISPESDYKGLDAGELKMLSDRFHEAVVATLEPEIAVVNKAGPGVMYLRAALTDVKLAHKKRGILGYTPIGLVVTTAGNLAGMRISLKEAVLEVEMLDAASGERIGVLVDKAPNTAGKELSWDAVNETCVFYATRLKSRMLAK